MEIGKNIAKKMVALMEKCSYIPRDATNEYHNYRYVSAAAVLEKVNSACAELGLATITTPKILAREGKIVTVEVSIVVTDYESGESLVLTGIGSGQDTGDKAVMKAQTAALKYAWMLSLQISTGDDPEADIKTDQAKSQPKSQPHKNPKITPGTYPEKGASLLLTVDEVMEKTSSEEEKAALLKSITSDGEMLKYWFRGKSVQEVVRLKKGEKITAKQAFFPGPKGPIATLWQIRKVS